MLTLGLYKEAEESAIKYLNRFGDHAFSNSISTSKIDIITDYTYIKLVGNFNSMGINPALLSGRIITGNRSGAKARVISYDSDSDSLYSGAIWVKYLAEDVITQEIQGIDVTHHGADYTTIPKLTITGGGGTGATARVVLNDVQTIIGVDVINSGSGYTSDPLITVIGGGGKGAQFKATLNTSKTFLEGERISTTDFSIFGFSASKNHSEKRSLEAVRGHFILAEIYNAMGKHEQALREYSQVGSEPKIKSESHNNRALIFIQQNLFDRAVKELDQAVKISPDLPATHFNIGNLLIQTNGNLIKARWHLEKALKFSSNKDRIEKIKQTLNTLL